MQKRGKRRWLFKKSSHEETNGEATRTITTNASDNEEKRHAIAVAMATTAAAQAAVATAQAAVEAVRLARPSLLMKKHWAAIVIQTAFRGYLVSLSLI